VDAHPVGAVGIVLAAHSHDRSAQGLSLEGVLTRAPVVVVAPGSRCSPPKVDKHANNASLALIWGMSVDMRTDTEQVELSVTEARDHFSERVNRAVYGGEVTFVTRGRNHHRAAAIVPADLVDHYEELLDERDARIAAERLADIEAGRSKVVPLDEAMSRLGLTEEDLDGP
jgi:prevent-host-death family protein